MTWTEMFSFSLDEIRLYSSIVLVLAGGGFGLLVLRHRRR
jgi:hypothetical protein